ncbi:hypothetical protein H9P43_005334 [Blastocladiella emersonii ATCC 22665]|nr:hypothetical protein H9P43_005334 [Blastocladiella emersonii ATCC 22665]
MQRNPSPELLVHILVRNNGPAPAAVLPVAKQHRDLARIVDLYTFLWSTGFGDEETPLGDPLCAEPGAEEVLEFAGNIASGHIPHTAATASALPDSPAVVCAAITMTYALYELVPATELLLHAPPGPPLFGFLVCAHPARFAEHMDWLMDAYRGDRAAMRGVVTACAEHLASLSDEGAALFLHHLRRASVLPALSLRLALRHGVAGSQQDDDVVPLLSALLNANARAIVREFEESDTLVADVIVHLAVRLREPHAPPVVQLQVLRLIALLVASTPTAFNLGVLVPSLDSVGLADPTLNPAVAAAMAPLPAAAPGKDGGAPKPVAPPLLATLSHGTHTTSPSERMREIAACVTMAVMARFPADFTAPVLAAWVASNPSLAVLVYHVLDNSWGMVERLVFDWLGAPVGGSGPGGASGYLLPNGSACVEHVRAVLPTSTLARAALLHAEGSAMLVLQLMQGGGEFQRAGLDLGPWLLAHILQCERVDRALIELVDQFIEGLHVDPAPCYSPLDEQAIWAHVTQVTSGVIPPGPRTAVLAYYVLSYTRRRGCHQHPTLPPLSLQLLHRMPLAQLVRVPAVAASPALYFALLGTLPPEYSQHMQSVRPKDPAWPSTTTTVSRTTAELETTENSSTIPTMGEIAGLVMAGSVDAWTRRFALYPMEVTVFTARTLAGDPHVQYGALLASPETLLVGGCGLATRATTAVTLQVLDFLLAASAPHMQQITLRNHAKADSAMHEVAIADRVRSTKCKVLRVLVEAMVPETKELIGEYVNRLFIREPALVPAFVVHGFHPDAVEAVVQLPAFHVFLDGFRKVLTRDVHFVSYVLTSLFYQYPLPKTLAIARSDILPSLQQLVLSSLGKRESFGARLGDANDQPGAVAATVTYFDVTMRAIVQLIRAFPELRGEVQDVLLATKQHLTQRIVAAAAPGHDEVAAVAAAGRAQLQAAYDALLATAEQVMAHLQVPVAHCRR